MSENIYQIVINGLKLDSDINIALDKLSTLFKCDREKLRPALTSRRFVAQSGLDYETAERLKDIFENAGCAVEIESELSLDFIQEEDTSPSTEESDAIDYVIKICKICGFNNTSNDKFCQGCGISLTKTEDLLKSQNKLKDNLTNSLSLKKQIIIFIISILTLLYFGNQISKNNTSNKTAKYKNNSQELTHDKSAFRNITIISETQEMLNDIQPTIDTEMDIVYVDTKNKTADKPPLTLLRLKILNLLRQLENLLAPPEMEQEQNQVDTEDLQSNKTKKSENH